MRLTPNLIVRFAIHRMTQCQLEKISFKILKEHTETDFDSDKEDLYPLLNEHAETNLDSVKDESELCSFTHDSFPEKEVKGQNLIRKVEMKLDSETDLHIYDNKYKIIVKKQAPFYMTKKTWKLLLSVID